MVFHQYYYYTKFHQSSSCWYKYSLNQLAQMNLITNSTTIHYYNAFDVILISCSIKCDAAKSNVKDKVKYKPKWLFNYFPTTLIFTIKYP